MRKLRIIAYTLAVYLAFSITSSAQTVTDCPHASGCVVISRDAAIRSLQTDDENKALKAELAAVKDAINGTATVKGYKDLLADMKVEFAACSGENTALKQNAVSDRAIMEIMLKNTKKRCAAFSILCL